MPISSLTAITPIAEGSEATPGLFNSRFSQLQQNLQELNQQAIGLLSGFVTGGVDSPESVQTGTPGFLYVQLNSPAEEHPLWVKFVGSGTTGWRGFAGFKGTGIDSYQVGRGASATGENSMALGRSSAAFGSAAQAWGYQAAATQPSASAWGPNSRASAANAVAGGLNAYAGQINAGAIGSAVTSDATGGWGFGVGTQVSHQSALVFSATGGASQEIHGAYFDYPLSVFSGALSASTLSVTAAQLGATVVSTLSATGASQLGVTQASTLSMLGLASLSTVTAQTLQVTSLLTVASRIVVNQGTSDAEIILVKSSDIAHGMTTRAETDTYGDFRKSSGVSGGMKLAGYSTPNAAVAMELSCEAGAGDTTKSTAARGALYVNGVKANGTGIQVLGANENIAAFANGGTTRFILDGDGDSHQDVGTAWTNFDTHDDIALLNHLSAHVTREDDPIRESFSGWLGQSREELEQLRLVAFGADGRPFLNLSRLAMLHTGAIRQLGAKLDDMQTQMTRLLAAPKAATE